MTQSITLTTKLGQGGEATIYHIAEQSNLVAKIYHNPTPAREAKLRAMLLNPPEQLKTHVAIAWPIALLYQQGSELVSISPSEKSLHWGDLEEQFIGFLMPKITDGRSIFHMYNPRMREQLPYPFDWRALHRTAYNLCAVVAKIHARGYVIGDINESNILVNREALVTIVDCDSFQVTDEHGVIHRCQVGKPEFTPPELQRVSFKEVDQRPEHDLFGLGVLLFQLLMEGYHPFAGVLNSNTSVGRVDLYAIREGLFPYGKQPSITPPPSAPEFTWLHPQVQQLFKACFELGHGISALRPTEQDWQIGLQLAEKALTRCQEKHLYGRYLSKCPHCHKTKQSLVQTDNRVIDETSNDQNNSLAVPSLEGTCWGGFDSHNKFYEHRFLPDGVLYYISSKTGGIPNCTWRQDNDKIYMSINSRYSEREGVIVGNRMSGEAWNIAGAKWSWEAQKGVTSPPKQMGTHQSKVSQPAPRTIVSSLLKKPTQIWRGGMAIAILLFMWVMAYNNITLPDMSRQITFSTSIPPTIVSEAIPPTNIRQLAPPTKTKHPPTPTNTKQSKPPNWWKDKAYYNGQTLDLSEQNLTQLPKEIGQLKDLLRLTIWNNKLTTLPKEVWQLTNLHTLHLGANSLTTISPEIGQLKSLQSLTLRGNKSLITLPATIGQLQNLQELHLSDTNLKTLPKEMGNLKNLYRLSISINNLTTFPETISQLQNLNSLALGDDLTILPPEIGQLQNVPLYWLGLAGNKLTTLPPEIGQLQSLQSLDVWENNLTTLPPEIGQLKNLRILEAWNNALTALPPEIGQLQRLEILELDESNLTILPPEIGQLKNLKDLDLSMNRLTILPLEIGQLQRLETLDLRFNRLTIIPPEIGQLQNLRGLMLWGNKLTALPPEIGQLQNLRGLTLSSNNLTTLPPEIGQLKNLEWLGLEKTNLTVLPPEIGQLKNLKRMDLSGNENLTTLPPEIGQLKNLEWLGLKDTNLTTLPPEIEQMANLTIEK